MSIVLSGGSRTPSRVNTPFFCLASVSMFQFLRRESHRLCKFTTTNLKLTAIDRLHTRHQCLRNTAYLQRAVGAVRITFIFKFRSCRRVANNHQGVPSPTVLERVLHHRVRVREGLFRVTHFSYNNADNILCATGQANAANSKVYDV